MKTSHCILLAATALIAGTQPGGQTGANAQSGAAPKPIGRFQISSWAYPAGPGSASGYGCFVLDTATGEVWSKVGTQSMQPAGDARVK